MKRVLVTILLFIVHAFCLTLYAAVSFSPETYIQLQRERLALAAENINKEIFIRFYVPTVMASGSISLRKPEQYERLSNVLGPWLQPYLRCRIASPDGTLSFSTDPADDFGGAFPAPENLTGDTEPLFTFSAAMPLWKCFFRSAPPPPGMFTLSVVAPLTAQEPLLMAEEGRKKDLMGILELTQDLGPKIQQAIAEQRRFLLFSLAVLAAGWLVAALVLRGRRA